MRERRLVHFRTLLQMFLHFEWQPFLFAAAEQRGLSYHNFLIKCHLTPHRSRTDISFWTVSGASRGLG